EAAHEAAFFNRNDKAAFANRTFNDLAIDWLGEAGIDDANLQAIGGEQISRLERFAKQRAEAEDRSLASPADDFGRAQFDRLTIGTRYVRCIRFGISNRDGTGLM